MFNTLAVMFGLNASKEAIESLKSKAREWGQKVVVLKNTRVPTNLEGEKAYLLRYAKTVKEAIEKVFPAFDQEVPQELGFIPVIVGAAAVASAAAAITYWSFKFATLMKATDEYNKLVSSGETPQNASNIVNQVFRAGQSETIGNTVIKTALPLILIGGTAYYFLTK